MSRALTLVVLSVLGALGSGLLALPADAAGILPPSNPGGNIPASGGNYLAAIDAARSDEGVGPMSIDQTAFNELPVPQQVFVALNLERIDRGEPAISGMTAQLDAVAQNGANGGGDPGLPTMLTGGPPVSWSGSVWAGSMPSVLQDDYSWMYDDGWGGSAAATSNQSCTPQNPSACWGHRDIILHQYANCPDGAPTLTMGAAYNPSVDGGSVAAVLVGSCGTPSDITETWQQVMGSVVISNQVVGVATLGNGSGYWEAQANGAVSNFGAAQNYGSMAGETLNAPIVGIAATPDGGGYWLVASDGGIFTFGDAGFYGSAGAIHLNQPIVGMTSTPDGKGYWMVASDGGIFSFGDAKFKGSTGNIHLNQPIVGMSSDPATGGYWLVAADGGIFSFGSPFYGSTGAIHLNRPIVGMEALSNGQGYRFVAADGGIFTFGQAGFDGSLGGQAIPAPVVSMAPDSATSGYWLAGSDGSIFSFGGAQYMGRVVS